jgi:hypothetical protein
MRQVNLRMDDQKKKDLVGILNSGAPSETARRDIMQVVLIPFLPDLPIGVYFTAMYGNNMKFIPRSVIPEKFRNEIDLSGRYIVTGNLMTKHARNLCFTEFEPAPELIEGLG